MSPNTYVQKRKEEKQNGEFETSVKMIKNIPKNAEKMKNFPKKNNSSHIAQTFLKLNFVRKKYLKTPFTIIMN